MTDTEFADSFYLAPPTAIELRQALVALELPMVGNETVEEMIEEIVLDMAFRRRTYCHIEYNRVLVLMGSTVFARDFI